MRICVYGAGAIGGHLAARLAGNGHEVTVIARGAHLAAMQAGGIVVRTPSETLHAEVRATDDPGAVGEQDAVIVTAKAPALPGIAPHLAGLLAEGAPVAFVMNGIPWWYGHDPDGIGRHVDASRAIGGVVYSACTVVAPGRIDVQQARSRLVLGEPDGALSPRLAALAGALRGPGLKVEEEASIRDWIWTKLVMNLASGPLSVLTRCAPLEIYAEPAAIEASRIAAHEGAAIARALGCTIRLDVDAQLTAGQSMTHKPSILQDLETGRPMEIATILDAPLALARQAGVATPMLDMMAALVRVRAGAR